MPYRHFPIVAAEIYHVFNRSIARQHIFLNQKDYLRALEVIDFYRFPKLRLRFSHFKRMTEVNKQEFKEKYMLNAKPQIEIIAYCLMPNHFHFLLRGAQNNSISKFITNFQHSYSNYFNLKNHRTGSVFQSMFKAVRVESDEQLGHVSRYIHLNPATSFLIKDKNLDRYIWSSYRDYFSEDPKTSFASPDLVLGQFKNKQTYKQFVEDQIDYQKQLSMIKHLISE